MTITVEFWHLISLLLGFLTCCFGFAKLLMSQFQSQLNERYQQQQKTIDKVEDIERQVHNLNATLPLNYVLREDYIRGQAIIEAKLDAVHKTLTDLYKMESTK